VIRYISNGCKEQVVSEDQRFLEKSAVPTVLGQKESSDAHFTPKVADFATLPQATIFMRTHKNLAVY